MKTNKSFTKRLKVTRRGKIVARKPGQNHFNAKESRNKQMNGRRTQSLSTSMMTKKVNQNYTNFK
ncbi:MAG: 50S ribosomal protein L35 [Patescibacteria group bacterium]